jgi:hypothetical protein
VIYSNVPRSNTQFAHSSFRSLRRTLAWREGISRPIAAPGAWCLPRIELRRRVTGPRLRLRFAEPLRTPCRPTGRRTLRLCRHSSHTRSRVSGIFNKHTLISSRRRVFRLNVAEKRRAHSFKKKKTDRSSTIAHWTELKRPGFSTSLHSFDIFREIKQRFGSISLVVVGSLYWARSRRQPSIFRIFFPTHLESVPPQLEPSYKPLCLLSDNNRT